MSETLPGKTHTRILRLKVLDPLLGTTHIIWRLKVSEPLPGRTLIRIMMPASD